MLAVGFAFLVAACSSPESKIEGKWVGKTGSLEFFKDKSGIINPPAGSTDLPLNVRYSWSLDGADTVKLEVGPPVEKVIFGKLEGGTAMIVEGDRFTKQ